MSYQFLENRCVLGCEVAADRNVVEVRGRRGRAPGIDVDTGTAAQHPPWCPVPPEFEGGSDEIDVVAIDRLSCAGPLRQYGLGAEIPLLDQAETRGDREVANVSSVSNIPSEVFTGRGAGLQAGELSNDLAENSPVCARAVGCAMPASMESAIQASASRISGKPPIV